MHVCVYVDRLFTVVRISNSTECDRFRSDYPRICPSYDIHVSSNRSNNADVPADLALCMVDLFLCKSCIDRFFLKV